MSTIMYLISILSLVFTITALSGRTTHNIYGKNRSYLTFNKISKDDPNRKLHISTQAILNAVHSLGFLGLGLYIDGIIFLSKNLITLIVFGYLFIAIVVAITYTTKVKHCNSKKQDFQKQTKPSINIGNIEIYYGVSTTKVFDNSEYLVAYDTIIQDPKIPFITCELQKKQDESYIGDIIFKSSNNPVSESMLRSTPIIQIHLDKK